MQGPGRRHGIAFGGESACPQNLAPYFTSFTLSGLSAEVGAHLALAKDNIAVRARAFLQKLHG